MDQLIEKKFPELIVKNLDNNDDIFINMAFEALTNFLIMGKHHPKSVLEDNYYCKIFKEIGIEEKLYDL